MGRRLPIPNKWKKELREYRREHPTYLQEHLQTWFFDNYGRRIDQSTISKYLSDEFSWLDTSSTKGLLLKTNKRRRKADYPELEDHLYLWMRMANVDNTLSGKEIISEAKRQWPIIYGDLEPPRFSAGWLDGFKKRYNIHHRIPRDETDNVLEESLVLFREPVKAIETPLNLSNVYENEENSLFCKDIPDEGLSTSNYSGTRSEKVRNEREDIVPPTSESVSHQDLISSIKVVVKYLKERDCDNFDVIKYLENLQNKVSKKQKQNTYQPDIRNFFSGARDT